ncbi:hypothetical protein GCG54_00008331 [Colletotrichum gloeosporioides]|uniref:Uncharacterized protein n=1 Tax=Colletotrichum gloeosporioides TaxID=474922 RepID=A0A8H4FE06_COLGL|nr:uncharacterized protein GCG54_00008331 [Colletotrichum gloeosporioides]KAF3798873.1 hypothetical protein GCG54_00008331 [Colletotrichum gloeosporioides]
MSDENGPTTSDAAPYSFTLKDLNASTWDDHPLCRTAYSMKRSGFHRWGFVIYRTTTWIASNFLRSSRDLLLTIPGPVMSDKATLDGASKADVRKHFISWRGARSEERDGPGATKDRAKRLPRFKHCVYVDRKCLDTLAGLPADCDEEELFKVVAVVIDGSVDEKIPGDEEGLYPDIEGCTARYVGWRYEDIEMLVDTYEESHNYPLSHIDYKRPPLISPNGLRSMPA